MKYRKKPVVIEAMQFVGTPEGANNITDRFCIPGAKFIPDRNLESGTLLIPTLEGNMIAKHSDWIIRGVAGEYYPCRNDIFQATYEPVT